MGVLQKIVQALQKLDPEAVWWKKRQIDRISNAIVKKQLKEKSALNVIKNWYKEYTKNGKNQL